MNYADSFSFEWMKHSRTQIDDKESMKVFKQKTGFTKEDFKGKLVLDAGCGAGRYTRVAKLLGAKVVAVDMSESVDVARQNTLKMDNVNIIRADINYLPFKDNIFDCIVSIGVLHHTPNTKKAFDSLPRLLKSGGKLAIWVYSNESFGAKAFNFITSFYRLVTTRMPRQWLYKLCKLAVPLYYLHRIPVLGYLTIALFPCSLHPVAEWRVLDTFDWFSPKYQHKHSYREVMGWFREQGLIDIERLGFPVAVWGMKP
jgi:ubiquinone/menaquinone biosynthesis C-methylase UbiE